MDSVGMSRRTRPAVTPARDSSSDRTEILAIGASTSSTNPRTTRTNRAIRVVTSSAVRMSLR